MVSSTSSDPPVLPVQLLCFVFRSERVRMCFCVVSRRELWCLVWIGWSHAGRAFQRDEVKMCSLELSSKSFHFSSSTPFDCVRKSNCFYSVLSYTMHRHGSSIKKYLKLCSQSVVRGLGGKCCPLQSRHECWAVGRCEGEVWVRVAGSDVD